MKNILGDQIPTLNKRFAVLAAVAIATATCASAAEIISVNLTFDGATTRSGGMSSTDLAGAPGVSVDNWNEISDAARTLSAAVYEDGTSVVGGFQVALTFPNGQFADRSGSTTLINDVEMNSSIIDVFSSATATVTNIPFATYDVYAYLRDENHVDRAGGFTIGATTYYARQGEGNPADDGTGYVLSTDTVGGALDTDYDQGNYVKFSNLTGSSFDLIATAENLSSSANRNKWTGFQIVEAVLAPDNDGDGMPDEYEDMFAFLDKNDDSDAALDEDMDDLTNLEEFLLGTAPDDDDSDDDTLKDGAEVNEHGTNPKSDDTDGDTINDDEELVAGADSFITDPLLADTDLDGISDSQEITDGTNPTDSNDPPPAEPMLIGHWPMDAADGLIAADQIGGNDAIWQNGDGLNLEWTQGQIGGAARLMDLGLEDYFRIDAINQLVGSNALTITAWIEPDENPEYNGIMMTRTIDGQTNNSWGLAFENTEAGPNHLDSRVDKAPVDSEADTLLPDGGWYHVALVWNGATGTHTQYINGVETGTTDASLNRQILETSGPWFLGYDDCCGGNRDFNGLIDDVGMWNQALTSTEIASIYENGLNGIGIGGAERLFQITEIVRNSDGSVDLTWTSDPRDGAEYSVLFSSDMTTPIDTWADVDDGVASEGETTSFKVPASVVGDLSRAFFAVRRNP